MQHSWHDEIVAGRGGSLGWLMRGLFWCLSLAYLPVVAIRNLIYDAGMKKPRRVSVPVISVGNMTAGGTGKTPAVIEICKRLLSAGHKPAVVSRGYKSTTEGVSDELSLISRQVSEAICVANPDRVAGAETAIRRHGADVIVLDDGFQHRRIGRDLDLVLIDATRPFGLGHLLPRGYLREPVGRLRQADGVVITRSNQVPDDELSNLKRQVVALIGEKPILHSVHAVRHTCRLGDISETVALERHTRVHLMSGVGNHRSFEATVEEIGAEICGHTRFADHHDYTAEDVEAVSRTAQENGAKCILVTEKDAVKLEGLGRQWAVPVVVVGVEIDFRDQGGKILDRMLNEVVSKGDGRDAER